MAVIKTGNSLDLSLMLADGVAYAFNDGSAVARGVRTLEKQIQAVAPELYGSGSSAGQSWETIVGDTRASHRVTEDGCVYGVWISSGSRTDAFAGSGLTGNSAGSLATGYSMSERTSEVHIEPGASGNRSYNQGIAAAIEFDRGAPGTVVVNGYTYFSKDSQTVSGYAYGVSSWLISSLVAVDGSVTYDLGSAIAKAVSGTIYSFVSRTVDSWREEGVQGTSEGAGLTSVQTRLTSTDGLKYLLDGELIRLSGTLSSMTFNYLYQWREEGSGSKASKDAYTYVDTASPDDDIDLAVLSDYLNDRNNGLYRQAVEAEFFKGDDTIVVTDHVNGGTIRAGAGNDRVIGGKVIDTLYGGTGSDVMSGGSGSDLVYGEAGNDSLRGEAGNDLLDGGAGDDLLDGGSGHDDLKGGDGNDRLLGGAGNDGLGGDGGDDVLQGGAGHDSLYGGEGDDVIEGGAGNDYIVGGAGRDIMSGGTGIDGFAFDLGDSGDGQLSLGSLDQIKGFNVSQDLILFEFDVTDIQLIGRGASYEALLADAEALDSRIVIGYDGANTYVFADMDDNGSLDLAIQLLGIKGDAVAQALQFGRG